MHNRVQARVEGKLLSLALAFLMLSSVILVVGVPKVAAKVDTSTMVACTPLSFEQGQTHDCTATLTGFFGSVGGETMDWSQSGTGSVIIPSSSCTLSSGSCSITVTGASAGNVILRAAFGGDANNQPSNGSIAITITQGTGTNVACGSSTLLLGASTTCTATVFGSSPTGTVTWSQALGYFGYGNLSISSSSCTLSSYGQCQVVATGASVGTVTLRAAYSGDSKNPSSSYDFNFAVTSVSATCGNSYPVVVGSSTACEATVVGSSPTNTPTGKVLWSSSGSGKFSPSSCTLKSGACSVNYTPTSAASPVNLTASYLGDKYNVISVRTFSLGVALKTSTTTLTCKPTSVAARSTKTIKCTAKVKGYSPTGTVTWWSIGVGVVSIPPDTTCTLTKGSCSVTFAGNSPETGTVQATYRGDPDNAESSGTFLLRAGAKVILVDSCGANPYNGQNDSDAIQDCINQAKSGDTILFTSPGAPGYKGYQIDKTIFLVMTLPVQTNLTFASTNPLRPALLNATNGLKGFVVQLCARSKVNCGLIHNIVLSNLQIDAGQGRRIVYGPDGGIPADSNWGSWLPECTVEGDSWCVPGGINMAGATDNSDPSQNYKANPDSWSTGVVVENMIIQSVPGGTALLYGGAAGTISNTTIETSGDHIFGAGCPPQAESGAWADGITFAGPDILVTDNHIYDASDVGIVFFGGENTTISNNYVIALPGDNGMFAGIGIHPWGFGDVSGVKVIGNTVENEGSSTCGGINAGINIGPQMWGGGCVTDESSAAAVGISGPCSANPPEPNGALCTVGQTCQVWAYVKAGSSLTLANNVVSGAYVNYLVDGLDLAGSFAAMNNTSLTPRLTNWPEAINGCTIFGVTNSWGPTNFVAYDPTLPGWTDIQIQCQ